MKIVSLLPSATEIVCLLGLRDHLVGITHECDYPPTIRRKPVLTSNAINQRGTSDREIDRHIRQHLHQGSSIYHLDRDALEKLNPDLILTQELCHVCAVSYIDVQAAVKSRLGDQSIISLEPTTLKEILATIIRVGNIVGVESRAQAIVQTLEARIAAVARATAAVTHRPRVFFWEWLDPIYIGGHWIPEMIQLAGGQDGLGRVGIKSRVGIWEEIRTYQPEVIILSPCGYEVNEILARASQLQFPAWWADLPAVRAGRVYAVNASAFFARPGPRIVDGLEILAQLLHPELNIRTLTPAEAQTFKREEPAHKTFPHFEISKGIKKPDAIV